MAFHVMHAGCGGMVHRGRQGPEHCHAEPTVAGLWFAAHGRTVWLGFACDQHAADLIAARPLLPATGTSLTGAATNDAPSLPGDDGQVRRKALSPVVQPASGSSNAPGRGPSGIAAANRNRLAPPAAGHGAALGVQRHGDGDVRSISGGWHMT